MNAVHVTPRSRSAFRRYADLVAFKSWADLRSETERTYLGFLWWLLEPLMFLGVFYLIFGLIRGRAGTEFVSFLLVGLVLWQWFRSAITHSGLSVFNSLFLLRQVKIPSWVLPLTVVVADTAKFLIVLVALVAVLWFMGHPPSSAWLALAPLLLTLFVLILGCGLVYAALCPFVPDLRFVVETVLTALMFVSGIFFELSEIPAEYRGYFGLNPIAILLDEGRRVLLDGAWPFWSRLVLPLVQGLGLTALGLALLHYCQRRYAKLAI